MSKLVEILTARSPSSPMESQTSARAVPGRGLVGDRYFDGRGTFSPHPQKPDFELTLIEREHVETFATNSDRPFTTRLARRNLVIEGVSLSELAGKEFFVGSVRIRGVRLCEPCNHLAKATWPEVLRGLVHKGGLRARILTEGIIRVGDVVRELHSP